jgi:hypothetical protein
VELSRNRKTKSHKTAFSLKPLRICAVSANPSAAATDEDVGVMLGHNIVAMNAVATLCKDWSRWRSGFDLGPLFAAIWNVIGTGRDVRRTATMKEGEVTAEDVKRQRAEYLEETVMEGMLERLVGTLTEEERVVTEKSKVKGVEARKHGRDKDEVSLGTFGKRRRGTGANFLRRRRPTISTMRTTTRISHVQQAQARSRPRRRRRRRRAQS